MNLTKDNLMRLNKIALVMMILKLQEENRLLRQNIVYTCMECGKDFEYSQVINKDSNGNVLCPYCNSGDISWGE